VSHSTSSTVPKETPLSVKPPIQSNTESSKSITTSAKPALPHTQPTVPIPKLSLTKSNTETHSTANRKFTPTATSPTTTLSQQAALSQSPSTPLQSAKDQLKSNASQFHAVSSANDKPLSSLVDGNKKKEKKEKKDKKKKKEKVEKTVFEVQLEGYASRLSLFLFVDFLDQLLDRKHRFLHPQEVALV
jgi:hypothetical protein